MLSGKHKGYYICNFNPFDPNHVLTGVDKKVISQIDTFNGAGLNCGFIYAPYASSKLRRGLGSLPAISDGIKWPKAEMLKDTEYIYIRRPLYSSKEFVEFMQTYKLLNPRSLILLEIPTYPYDAEFSGYEMYFALKKDRKYRNMWHKYVNYIVDLSGEKKIFGIPVLPIINGIDLSRVRVRTPSVGDHSEINIVFSAFFAPWHGYDLLLKGLAEYYRNGGTRKITLHLVGGGNLIDRIKKMIEDMNLCSHVILYGTLSQDRLDKIFDICSFAVGSLGLHRRSGNCRDSSLKTREYLAKGIPFIYAGSIDVFEQDPVDFCLQLPSVEASIDFNRLISFYDNLYENEEEEMLIKKIRAYADKHISMDKAMKSVVDTIAEHIKGNPNENADHGY